MDAELKQRWIGALRSDQYKQGHGYLKVVKSNEEARYCCLGVLCEQMGLKQVSVDSDGIVTFAAPDSGQSRCVIPSLLALKLGLKAEFQGQRVMDVLVEMNDNEHKNFDEIADWIETNL